MRLSLVTCMGCASERLSLSKVVPMSRGTDFCNTSTVYIQLHASSSSISNLEVIQLPIVLHSKKKPFPMQIGINAEAENILAEARQTFIEYWQECFKFLASFLYPFYQLLYHSITNNSIDCYIHSFKSKRNIPFLGSMISTYPSLDVSSLSASPDFIIYLYLHITQS